MLRMTVKPNPCATHTPILGGLLACARGNRAERLAAEREEWSHILVYEPTPRSTKSDSSLPQHSHKPIPKRGPVSPLTILTDGTSLEASKAQSGSRASGSTPIHSMPNKVNVPVEKPKPSLLLERRKAALKAKMEATMQNTLANSSLSVTIPPPEQEASGEQEDTRDAGETVERREETRDLGNHVTFSDEEDNPSLPALKESSTNPEGFRVPGFNAKLKKQA